MFYDDPVTESPSGHLIQISMNAFLFQPYAISTDKVNGREGLEKKSIDWLVYKDPVTCESGPVNDCADKNSKRKKTKMSFKCKSYMMGSGFMEMRQRNFDEL